MAHFPLHAVPDLRITSLNQASINTQGRYILYWMIAQRRCTWNFALQHALCWSQKLKKPLIIFEPLRIGYPWASERMHQFIIDGMKDQQYACKQAKITYYPYLENQKDGGKGLVKALSKLASVVITDDFPCFFLPKMLQATAPQISCLFQKVDSNGILPLRSSERVFTTAASFRRHMQKTILPYLQVVHFPDPNPLSKVEVARNAEIPQEILQRWPKADFQYFDLASIAINHQIKPN